MRKSFEEREHEGIFIALSKGDEILDALNNADLKRAATLLRDVSYLPQPYLAALADMLDGDPKTNPAITERFIYRLRLAPWGIRGRKPKGSRARSFTSRNKKSKPHPSDAMLCSKVTRKMVATPELSRAAAVAEVAKANGVSTSLVEKAFDKCRGTLQRSSSVKKV